MDEQLKQIKLDNLRKGRELQSEQAIQKYYADPAVCKYCHQIIKLDGKQKPSEVKKKQFCNHSCAARFNNKGVNRWAKWPSTKAPQTIHSEANCIECGKEIKLTPRKGRGNYYLRRYCDDCLTGHRRKTSSQRGVLKSLIEGLTKQEVRDKAKTFQYYQIYINKHARKVYNQSGRTKECKVCGYSLHTEICHIKDVKDFSGDTLISVINHIDNLVALCRNHHWEFDHGHLKIVE